MDLSGLEGLAKEVSKANKKLVSLGLVAKEQKELCFGNVSAINQDRDTILIKPSGVSYSDISAKKIVPVDMNGKTNFCYKPSVDTPIHWQIYSAFPKVGAVVHTHSLYATAFAQAVKPIKCLGTTHADFFHGDIPVAYELSKENLSDYEQELGRSIVRTFKKNKIDPAKVPACLVPHHGSFVWGKTINDALKNASALEYIAQLAIMTASIDPQIKSIPIDLLNKHYFRKHGRSSYYGQEK